MTQSEPIKLSPAMKNAIRELRTGKVLCVHKKKMEANLAMSDYSFHSFISNKLYHTLLVEGLIKKTDSRTISDIYTLTELGYNISIK
jgi:hypothetical protein